ncbi:hypothetical protein PGT21_033750 [Puccinia graminis f. sp. tritici]|uniref:Uncharacterized protein n=1 Tax=Puccinia graminis f. sp. tritici TaxID=56615 RepID=A0A5B0M1I9_PUCGR|nr:hypothetical protein PGT21_033750 [Puccinia graminis f. sp. tritici]
MTISGFVTVSQPDGRMKYVCQVCDGRGMDLVYLKRHLNTPGHQSNALRRAMEETRRTIEAQVEAQLNALQEDDIVNDAEELFIPRRLLDVHNEAYHPPQVDLNDQTGMGFGGADSSSNESSSGQPVCRGTMDWDQWNMPEDYSQFTNDYVILPGQNHVLGNSHDDEDMNPTDLWYPFPAKEYLISTLMLGHLHNLLSRNVYHLVRLSVSLGCLDIPHWDTIRRRREQIRKMLDVKLNENISVLDNKVFTLSLKDTISHELSNPYLNNELYAKCIAPKMKNFATTELPNNQPQIQLMIPQMISYDSPQLINIPVRMFDLMCSEMKWGDGTPFLTKIRRQLVEVSEFGGPDNTSNVAGALEIAEPIVNQINELATDDAADRTGIRYIQQFFGIPHLPKPRSWIDTKENAFLRKGKG